MAAEETRAQEYPRGTCLLGGIAHDFNNLLMGIQGNVSLMLMELDSDHPHYDGLKRIEGLVDSGARLTSQLLGYARKGRDELRPVDLRRLVEETVEAFGRTRKDIRIHQEIAKDLLPIDADRGQIEQVLLNLFINAGDAMPDGGQLTLRAMNASYQDVREKLCEAKRGRFVLLTVSDTGIGMDKAIQEKIFDPFFTTKEMKRRTGLGLSSAYGIIKNHGGFIHVDSEKGKGSTFSIYLPASEKRVTIRKNGVAHDILKGAETVLLVDDEEAILEVGKRMLQVLGYEPLVARKGKEAVDVYRQNRERIDLVVLDMIMPDMGGGEVYDRMKENNPSARILLSSGYSIDGQAAEILERGCDGFIQKPFNIRELSERIRGVLDKK